MSKALKLSLLLAVVILPGSVVIGDPIDSCRVRCWESYHDCTQRRACGFVNTAAGIMVQRTECDDDLAACQDGCAAKAAAAPATAAAGDLCFVLLPAYTFGTEKDEAPDRVAKLWLAPRYVTAFRELAADRSALSVLGWRRSPEIALSAEELMLALQGCRE